MGIQIPINEYFELSALAMNLLGLRDWNSEDIAIADLLIRISNTLYNNTSADVLPLDDGIYDQLLVRFKGYNPNYQVGAIPVKFKEEAQNEVIDEKVMCTIVDMDSKLYMEDIWKQHTPMSTLRKRTMCFQVREPITKRLINTTHKYPELVGTLDKCKFVLNNDAVEKEVFDKPTVQVFERDFIHKCLDKGVIRPDEVFDMVCELKYDGISVEAEVCGDTIISALSRGDTADNVATDLTPILGGYKFPCAKDMPTDVTFGIKFEAVITKFNLDRLGAMRQRTYKNCRNAIIGLFGASDAYKYIDFITLIPLSTSLEMDRESELIFLNRYYNSGEYNRHVFVRGDYKSILFQVKQFTESAEAIRPILPYMIDGVVISFTDPAKIAALGRENSVNKYQMAIKFNPRKNRTIFMGYTYSIGKSGDIIPMVHFKPCEFIGGIHTKQTIHSYDRFKNLNLIKGQQIDVEYVNDVISYVTKPDTEFNRSIQGEPEQFITRCPSCGGPIVISDSGKSAKCVNPYCHERMIMRMADMLDKLGFKDIAEETVRQLDLTSLCTLVEYKIEDLTILGPKTSMQLIGYINKLKSEPIEDWRIMSAMSFSGMAAEKWRKILKQYTIKELLDMSDEELVNSIVAIPGMGNAVAEAILTGRTIYEHEMHYVIRFNLIDSKGIIDKPKIALTGFRDPEFIDLINANGFDASDSYGVTKQTAALITNDLNSTSSKMQKANKYGIPIYTKQSFLEVNKIKF